MLLSTIMYIMSAPVLVFVAFKKSLQNYNRDRLRFITQVNISHCPRFLNTMNIRLLFSYN